MLELRVVEGGRVLVLGDVQEQEAVGGLVVAGEGRPVAAAGLGEAGAVEVEEGEGGGEQELAEGGEGARESKYSNCFLVWLTLFVPESFFASFFPFPFLPLPLPD